eukprot:s627_g24.t1
MEADTHVEGHAFGLLSICPGIYHELFEISSRSCLRETGVKMAVEICRANRRSVKDLIREKEEFLALRPELRKPLYPVLLGVQDAASGATRDPFQPLSLAEEPQATVQPEPVELREDLPSAASAPFERSGQAGANVPPVETPSWLWWLPNLSDLCCCRK